MSLDYPLGQTVHILFTTRQFSTGAPFTLAGTPALSVYEDASITQITAGVSVGVDHDAVTGLNLATIVATTGNGFEAGKSYHIVITTGTVDSVSVVGEVVGAFSIERSAANSHFDANGRVDVGSWLGTAVATPSTAGVPHVNTVAIGNTTQTARDLGASVLLSSGTGTGQVSLASGKVLLQATQTGVTIPTVTTLTGHTPQTGDSFARLGAPAGASVSADVAAVKTDTGNLVTRITSTLFSGITSLAEWIGLLAGKQTGNATALTEIKATGAGSGTYDPTTDSTEALAAALATVDNEIAVIDGIVDDLKSGIIYGTAATGTLSATQATTNLTGYADDQLIGRHITVLSGSAEGEQSDITDYANTGGLLTFTAMTVAMANGDTFKIT